MAGKIIIRLLFVILLILGSSNLTLAQEKPDEITATELISYYFDLFLSGNYESAAQLWEPTALERATRLGIEYDGIPVKPDCNSPVQYDFARMREFHYSGVQSRVLVDSGIFRLKFAALAGGTRIEHNYLARKFGKDFWFIFPQDYYTAGWPTRESKYFRFHINPAAESFCNELAVQSLDDFVENTAAKILIPKERLVLLAEKKIDYYFCLNEAEVTKISGENTKGVYDLCSDAIITSIFPHYHEVAHLLVNFKLQHLPLFTAPFMQEGSSVWLGGRWQRAPQVMVDFGRYILKYGVTEIDSILITDKTGGSIGSDIAYPVSAAFVEFIFNTLGPEKYFDLYRRLSGDFQFIQNMRVENISGTIAESFGRSWDEIKKEFDKSLGTGDPRGLIYPGKVATQKDILNDSGLTLSLSDRWLQVLFHPDSSSKIEIGLIFGKNAALADKNSSLYNEQYKTGHPFAGYRYGIRIDKNEIGLYDYATNQLLAKYVHDFNPNPGYYDSTANNYTAYFDVALLKNILPAQGDYEILK
jgi:hypothetical protein